MDPLDSQGCNWLVAGVDLQNHGYNLLTRLNFQGVEWEKRLTERFEVQRSTYPPWVGQGLSGGYTRGSPLNAVGVG